MTQDLEILKRLLAEADEEEATKADDTEELPKEEKPKKGSFEDDPMGFILKKYNSLNELLQELMTDSFKEYVDGIFLIAPKPTTFKLVLHNGQYFFLTYMGSPRKSEKEGVYEATIEGKRYYLDGIGEKERCMMAIAKLLRFGSPLKTKGPEGAEQSTRENTGMEGDWAEKTGMTAGGTEETGTEPAGEEAGAEGGEELKENLEILKRILIKEAKEDLVSIVKKAFEDSGIKLRRNSDAKLGIDYRGNLGDKEKSIKTIESVLKKIGLQPGDYSLEYLAPKEYSKGAKSGSYPTYKIKLKKSISQNIKKGEEFFAVSTVKGEESGNITTTITQKSLTPVNLGISGDYKSLDKLVSDIDSSVKKQHPDLYPLLSSLINDVITKTSKQEGGLSKIKTVSKDIAYSDKTKKLINQYSPSDTSIIGKDFGELLGGLFLAKLSGIKKSINYPEGNASLFDFIIDDYKISSKYNKGAAASITDLVKDIDPKSLKKNSSEEKFYNALKPFVDKSVTAPDAFLNVAKSLRDRMPSIQTLANIIGVSVDNLTRQNINDFIVRLVKNKKSNESKTKSIMYTFGDFYKEIGRSPKGGEIEWDKISEKGYYGIVTSPFSYYIKDRLNEVPEFLADLKNLVAKTEVKQMYMLFSGKNNSINFTIKSFNDPNAKFVFEIPSISVNNPAASKLGFKLK